MVDVVRFVKHAQDLGYSLSDVEDLPPLADGRAASCAQARAIGRALPTWTAGSLSSTGSATAWPRGVSCAGGRAP
jgi:hypothetical protein